MTFGQVPTNGIIRERGNQTLWNNLYSEFQPELRFRIAASSAS